MDKHEQSFFDGDIGDRNINESMLENDPTPRRRASDILEIVEAKYVPWEKLNQIIIGFITGLMVGGFVVGWILATNISDYHNHKDDMTHRVGVLELKGQSISVSIDSNTQAVKKLNETISTWRPRH
jgi:hypothetical protein